MNMRIGMLGYGAQGRAEAANLRKSKLAFKLGLREGPSKDLAQKEGFEVLSIEDCVAQSDILFLNLPDQAQAGIFQEYIRGQKHIRWLIFAHGFNTYFKLIPVEDQGPAHVLIAPKGAASGLEHYYKTPNALPGILAAEATKANPIDSSGRKQIEDLALALGCHPQALVWANFKDECVCDLFSEQALLCGGISSLLRKSYEVLVEAGYNSDTAYFETLYELKLIVDLLWKDGISGMRNRISPTARYGDVTRGERVIDENVKSRMKEVLQEIESGKFAKEFLAQINSEKFRAQVLSQAEHPIEKVGQRLRQQMKS